MFWRSWVRESRDHLKVHSTAGPYPLAAQGKMGMVLGVIDSPQPQYTVLAKKPSYEIRRYILAKVRCLKAHNRATCLVRGSTANSTACGDRRG
jgi:hypothetical protein